MRMELVGVVVMLTTRRQRVFVMLVWNAGPPQEGTVRGREMFVLLLWWDTLSIMVFGRLNVSLLQGVAVADAANMVIM